MAEHGVTGSVRASGKGEIATLYVQGSFAFHLQNDFRHAYESLASKNKSIQIDLNDTDYMDSSGLGMLLVMKKYLDAAKVEYEIVRSHGQTQELLAMTHFDQYFRINGAAIKAPAG